METNSPNGSGKSSWRERLGIGSKELPKIAGEFSAKPGEPKIAPRPAAARTNQTVTRPAPMAPRPAPGTRSAAATGRPAITPQTSPDSLAERLRAQRAAAEKLAEQRVASAKDRAPPTINGSGRHGNDAKPAAERPKFSFADDQQPAPTTTPAPAPAPVTSASPAPAPALKRELPPPPRVSPSPITPPRPALGGEPPRPSDPLRTKPAVPHYQSQFTPPPGGYRPLDPPGYQQYPSRPPTRPYTPPSYGTGPGEPRFAQPARPAYRRPAEEEEFYEEGPRRQRPLRARAPAAEDDLDEVFEDEVPPVKSRRRASAQDYGRAYREYEDEFADNDRRRSRGPFMVLAGLVALAALIGGGIWAYSNIYKPRMQSTANTGEVPVVAAPADPAKVDPPAVEPPATTDAAPTQGSKQFYDRILGEQTIEGGQLVPTEEAPVTLAPGATGTMDAAPLPAAGPAEPAATAPPDPATEALPLPLPPPAGGETQGLLPKSDPATVASEKVIPAAAPTAEDAMAPVPGEPTPAQTPAETAAAPPPDPASTTASEPPPTPVAAVDDDPVEDIKPATKKAKPKAAEAKTKRRPKDVDQVGDEALGAKPVVLVPPSTDVAAVTPDDPASALPPPAVQPVDEPATSGSFFGSSGNKKLQPSGKGAENRLTRTDANIRTNFKGGAATAPPVADAAPDQVASIAEDAPSAEPLPEPQTTRGTSGFVVQLGSYRTQQEAQAEANRLKSKTAALSGVSTSVVRATVFGSSRYRVMTSPVGDRAAGERICEELLRANEQNCSVKAQ